MNKKITYLLLFLAILVINIIVYSPCINAYFVNDDYNWIKPAQFTEIISSFWGGWGHGALYRPLTRLLFYAEYLLFNNSPAGYHLISLFLQSLVVFLFYLIIKSLFNNKTSIIFLPLTVIFFYPHHEVICWISSQTILLSTTFLFLSLLYFLKYLENKSTLTKYIYSLIFFLLGLMSYEMVVIVPFLVTLILFLKNDKHFFKQRSFLQMLIPFVLLTVLYLAYRKIILAGLPEANAVTFNVLDWTEDFLKLVKFQFVQNIFLSVLFIAGILYLFLVTKERKLIYFSLAWFLLCYIPFLFVNGYTGRFAYLSMFGILFLISMVMSDFYSSYRKFRVAAVIIFLVYIAFNGFKIYKNSEYWHEAGEIAHTIPLQLKNMHTAFPDNSTLIFYDIPLGYKQSGVFLTYFEDVIQGEYPNKLNIIHVAHPFNKDFSEVFYKGKTNVYWFKFELEKRKLIELD